MTPELRDEIMEKLKEASNLLPVTETGRDMERLLEIHGDIHRAIKKLCKLEVK